MPFARSVLLQFSALFGIIILEKSKEFSAGNLDFFITVQTEWLSFLHIQCGMSLAHFPSDSL